MVLVAAGVGALVGWLWASGRQLKRREALLARALAADGFETEVAALTARLDGAREEILTLRTGQASLEAEHRGDQEKVAWTEQADRRLRETFDALASRALSTNAEAFLQQTREQMDGVVKQLKGDWSTQKEQLAGVVQPVEKSLKQLDDQVRQLEQRREGAYRSLEQHIVELRTAHQALRDETGRLHTALTTSARVRGRWGELQLRRIVEMSGLLDRVDFDEQTSVGDQRPDMIVHIPNGGILPVDAKTSMESYFQALDATDEPNRQRLFKAHAGALKQHIRTLGNKAYWKQFEHTPEVVVMFVPTEACLSAAFQEDPQMLEFGLEQHVLVATPVTLYGLLKAVAYGWQQQAMAENARHIADEGRDLCDRMGVFLTHFSKAGRALESAVGSYNEAVGSAESRLVPSARRLRDLGASTREPVAVAPVELQVRESSAGEKRI